MVNYDRKLCRYVSSSIIGHIVSVLFDRILAPAISGENAVHFIDFYYLKKHQIPENYLIVSPEIAGDNI